MRIDAEEKGATYLKELLKAGNNDEWIKTALQKAEQTIAEATHKNDEWQITHDYAEQARSIRAEAIEAGKPFNYSA